MRHISTLTTLLLCLLLGTAHAAGATDDAPQAQDEKFSFTGFTNITLISPAVGPIALSADDLGLFGSKHISQAFNPFFEAELAGNTFFQQGGNVLSNGYPHLLLERLFNDSYLTNNLTLRVGKMLSPVGEWNLIHVPPLVLTTVRPMTTIRGFSGFTSGASLIYNDAKGRLPDIQVYAQPWTELRSRPQDIVPAGRNYEQVSGLHLNWSLGLNDKVGLSVQNARITYSGDRQTLTGFNFSKQFGPLEFETEAFHTHISGTNTDRLKDNEQGDYVQSDYALNECWHLVGRYEYFADRGSRAAAISTTASKNSVLGFAYKTTSASPQVWKFESVKQTGQRLDIQSGLFASFSNLF